MKPEKIVVSLEWSKKLKEVGWQQRECLYRWAGESVILGPCQTDIADIYAAPTAEEILRRLPPKIRKTPTKWLDLVVCPRWDGAWMVSYSRKGDAKYHFLETSIANAAAAMWCYLAENNLLPK